MAVKIEDLIENIARLGASSQQGVRIEYRSAPSANWDVKVILGEPAALPGLQGLLRDPPVAAQLDVRGANAFIRFDDKFIAGEIDRALAGDVSCHAVAPLGGHKVIVQFLDPNSTKAMHLGHLYEAILGNALAALLRSLGADVRCYCFVSDISRSVCEAMAGFEAFGNRKTPAQSGEKPDHMVGRLYAQYAERYYTLYPDEAGNEDPIRRETGIVGDRADELMRLYQAGDGETRALWRKIRDWVVDGQLTTLSRLHVDFDTIQFGSDFDGLIEEFIARGVQSGVLEREPSGTVLYHSGKREYETVVMARPDGFPTEHTRQMAQMISVFATCAGLDRYYTFMGMEWKPAWTIYEDILRGCGGSPYHDIVAPVCHGMVMVEGSKMKSSNGAALLADEFLDRVEGLREVHALAARTDNRVCAATVRDIVVKAFFLSRRMAKDINFAWSQVVSPADNPGWSIASAWCAAHCAHPAAPPPRADQLDLERMLFLRGFDLTRALKFAAGEIDLSVAVKSLHRISETVNRVLAESGNDRLGALSASVLRHGLTSLGISSGDAAVATAAELPPRRSVG